MAHHRHQPVPTPIPYEHDSHHQPAHPRRPVSPRTGGNAPDECVPARSRLCATRHTSQPCSCGRCDPRTPCSRPQRAIHIEADFRSPAQRQKSNVQYVCPEPVRGLAPIAHALLLSASGPLTYLESPLIPLLSGSRATCPAPRARYIAGNLPGSTSFSHPQLAGDSPAQ
jgi:hypothetical protein